MEMTQTKPRNEAGIQARDEPNRIVLWRMISIWNGIEWNGWDGMGWDGMNELK